MAGEYKVNSIDLGEINTPPDTVQPGFRVMSPEEKEAFARIKAGTASEADLQLFSKYSDDELINQFQFGPKSVEAVAAVRQPQTEEPQSVVDTAVNDPQPVNLFDAPQQVAQTPDTSNIKFDTAGLNAWNPVNATENQRHLDNINAGTQTYENKIADRKAKLGNIIQNINNTDTGLGNTLSGALSAWTPLAASVFGGGDPSGFASAQRAQAAQYDKNAAENQKIMQWNKQRATDNTLADKIAAAEAAGAWKQNANARGAEGGASVVAASNETVTPDIMAQKNYQSQQMNTATQNLAEVNRNKLEANAARGDANQADYQDSYMNSKDAYTQNLATAKGAGTTSKDTKESEETKPAENKPTETKPAEKQTDNTVEANENENGSIAPTNQESDAVEDATEQTAQDQADMTNILNGVGDYDWKHDYYKRLEEEKNKSAISGR